MLAMIVEDNTGLDNAESYISVDDAIDYFEMYGGGDTFGLDISRQEQALRNGTRIVDGLIRWTGDKLDEDQALEFPRTRKDKDGNSVTVEIPKEVKEAVADIAELWLNDDLSMQPIVQERYGDTSVTYAYPQVESKFLDIKKRLLKYGAYSATVVTTYRA
jgi:hypothetical protein